MFYHLVMIHWYRYRICYLCYRQGRPRPGRPGAHRRDRRSLTQSLPWPGLHITETGCHSLKVSPAAGQPGQQVFSLNISHNSSPNSYVATCWYLICYKMTSGPKIYFASIKYHTNHNSCHLICNYTSPSFKGFNKLPCSFVTRPFSFLVETFYFHSWDFFNFSFILMPPQLELWRTGMSWWLQWPHRPQGI